MDCLSQGVLPGKGVSFVTTAISDKVPGPPAGPVRSQFMHPGSLPRKLLGLTARTNLTTTCHPLELL